MCAQDYSASRCENILDLITVSEYLVFIIESWWHVLLWVCTSHFFMSQYAHRTLESPSHVAHLCAPRPVAISQGKVQRSGFCFSSGHIWGVIACFCWAAFWAPSRATHHWGPCPCIRTYLQCMVHGTNGSPSSHIGYIALKRTIQDLLNH